jgi:hypothetical protein
VCEGDNLPSVVNTQVFTGLRSHHMDVRMNPEHHLALFRRADAAIGCNHLANGCKGCQLSTHTLFPDEQERVR